MVRRVTNFLDQLSPAWQALISVGGAITFGFVVALALAGWIELPAEVEEQGNAIVELRTDVSRLQRSDSSQTADLRRIRCLVEAAALKADPIAKCGL